MAAISIADYRQAGLLLLDQAANAAQAISLEPNSKEDHCKNAKEKLLKLRSNEIAKTELVRKILDSADEHLTSAKPNPQIRDHLEDCSSVYHFKDLAIGAINCVKMAFASKGLEAEYNKFITAVKEDNIQTAEEMIAKGVNPDYAVIEWNDSGDLLNKKETHITALGLACISGSKKMVNFLIEKRANPNFGIIPGSSTSQSDWIATTELEAPIVTPAWLALLTSRLPAMKKKEIWLEFQGKADPMLREGEKWWISRCFYTTHVLPETLNLVLSQAKNVQQASQPILKGSNLNLMHETFYDIPAKILSSEERGQQFSAKQITHFQHHTLKLGAVLIYHGMEIPQFISEAAQRYAKNKDDSLAIWALAKTKVNGRDLTFDIAARNRKNQEPRSLKQTGWIVPQDDKQAKAVIKKVTDESSAKLMSIKDLGNIIAEYTNATNENLNRWIAEECFNATFKPTHLQKPRNVTLIIK